MKTKRNVWSMCYGWKGIFLILYCSFILIADVFVSFNSWHHVIIASISIFVGCSFLCPAILKFAHKTVPKEPSKKGFPLTKKQAALIFFVMPLILFLALLIVYYPGGWNPDTLSQYEQAITSRYSDAHPVFHTLLFFKLPLIVSGGWAGSLILFQDILLSAVLSYGACFVYERRGIRWAVASMFIILLNPGVWVLATHPWKDTAFAMGALLLTIYSIQIYDTKGEWLKRHINMAGFIALLVSTTLFRHNAILFTFPLLIAVLFCVSKKQGVIICVCFFLLVSTVKGPLYTALEVEKADARQTEMLGLPMTVIGGVVANDPQALDAEIKTFAYAIAPQELWENNYIYGDYSNTIKWFPGTNNQVIEDYGAPKVISMMLRCLIRSPKAAITALIRLTGPVYTVSDEYHLATTVPGIVLPNEFGIATAGIPSLQAITNNAKRVLPMVFPHVFEYLGVIHLILIITVLSKCSIFEKTGDRKKVLFVLPLFIYNFGSALLLTCFSDALRFFTYTRLLFPVLLVFLLQEAKEDIADNLKRK